MAARHGTRRGYGEGCRCDDCKDAQRLYQRRYRERQALRNVTPVSPDEVALSNKVGPVESAVKKEIAGLAAEARPGLVAVAVAMARILDNSRVPAPKPAAAKVLVSVMDTLHKSAQGRRGNLAVVRTMVEKGNESG
jgi:hypothetical protein